MSITYSECVFVVFGTQRVKRMCRLMLSSVACPAVPYFCTLSPKWLDSRKKATEEKIYRVSHELRSLLRESVPNVKIYRYNPKHLCPKLNGYGDNGQRKVLTSCISA